MTENLKTLTALIAIELLTLELKKYERTSSEYKVIMGKREALRDEAVETCPDFSPLFERLINA